MINDVVSHAPPGLSHFFCTYITESTLQIDWDESRLNKGHVAVKSGVDSDLDELRRRYHGLSSLLVR